METRFKRGVGCTVPHSTAIDSEAAPVDIEIRASVGMTDCDGTHATLYAYFGNERIAALDFTRTERDLCINMIFVKPEFRRAGIGSALVRHFASQYPGVKMTCGAHAGHDRFLDRALTTMLR